MVDMRRYARVLLDASVIEHAPPEKFRAVMASIYANSVKVFTSGSYDAQNNQNHNADVVKKLKNYRENSQTVAEYNKKDLPLEIETLRTSYSDIRTTAREMARICERNGQRMLLVTADSTLCMSVVLQGIKVDILRFSADAQKANDEEFIPIEMFSQKTEEIAYPWQRNIPHKLHEQMPVADIHNRPLILRVKDPNSDRTTPIVLDRVERQGGEACLYLSDENPGVIAKIYKSLNRAKLNNIQKLMVIRQHNEIRHVILPAAKLIDDQGNEVGYLMQYVKDFKPLANDQVFLFKDIKNLDVKVLDAVHFCLKVVWQIRDLACLGILVYDFNDNNIGIDASTNEPVLLDADSSPFGEYLPVTVGNDFYVPDLEHDNASRADAISICLKTVYLFVAYTLLGKPPVDSSMKLSESWGEFSYRIPEPLGSFLKRVVQMKPEEVPYLDELIDQLNVAEKSLNRECTYRHLLNVEPPKRERKAHRFDPWEPVLRAPRDNDNEPKFQIDRDWFNLFPDVRTGAEVFGWKRPKKPVKPVGTYVVGVPARPQYPPKVSDESKKRQARKKCRIKRLRIALVILVLIILLMADQKYIDQIPVLIGKIREILTLVYERTVGALWDHPQNPIPGWIESLKSMLFPQ